MFWEIKHSTPISCFSTDIQIGYLVWVRKYQKGLFHKLKSGLPVTVIEFLKVMLLSLPFGVIHTDLVGTVSILTRREERD